MLQQCEGLQIIIRIKIILYPTEMLSDDNFKIQLLKCVFVCVDELCSMLLAELV